MALISAQLTKSFLRASCSRHAYLHRPVSGLNSLTRRWISTPVSSTSPDEQVPAKNEVEPAPKKRRGRPLKSAVKEERKEQDVKPKRKYIRKPKAEVEEVDGQVDPPLKKTRARITKPKVEEKDEVKKTRWTKVHDKLPDGSVIDSRKLPPKSPGARKLIRKNAPFDLATLHTSTVELPPAVQWPYFFPYSKENQHRTTIQNADTARKVAEALVPKGSKDKIIIEAYAGAGLLTRALLALPKERIKKLIVIEDSPEFVPFIKSLEEIDPRLISVPKEGKQWTTYTDLEAAGLLDDVQSLPWDQLHDKFQYIMQVATDTHGEQLVSQILRAIPDKQWLFKYGRVPVSFVLTERMWARLKALPDTHIRCKVSVMAEAVVTMRENLSPEALQPHSEHFYPQRSGVVQMSEVVITLNPRADAAIPPGDLDFWDYCLRKLFVMRATPLEKCIGGLGPGAKNILPAICDPSLPPKERLDPTRTPRQLDLQEWALVVNAFKRWPFKPEDLSIEAFNSSSRR